MNQGKPSQLHRSLCWWTRAHAVIAGATAVAVVALYAWSIRPASGRLASLEARGRDVRRELNANSSKARQLQEVVADVAALRRQLADIGQLPKRQELASFINDFSSLSRETAVRRLAWTPDPSPRRTDWYTELPINFTFEGDFLSVFDFLRRTEDMPRLTNVRRLEMKNRDGQGQVDVQLTMNLYFGQD